MLQLGARCLHCEPPLPSEYELHSLARVAQLGSSLLEPHQLIAHTCARARDPNTHHRFERVLLLDADCALVGGTDPSSNGVRKLEALLKLPYDLVVSRYPIGQYRGGHGSGENFDRSGAGSGVASDEYGGHGGIWVNSAAMLVKATPWTFSFIEAWWRVGERAHWYAGDQGALWYILALALTPSIEEQAIESEGGRDCADEEDGEAKMLAEGHETSLQIDECLLYGIPTHSRLLQRCLGAALGANLRRCENGHVYLLDPTDRNERLLHFWSALEVARMFGIF